MTDRRSRAALAIVLVLLVAPHAVPPLQAQERQDRDLASRTFVAMPLVNTNPTMKTSIGGIGMLLFRPNRGDSISPPSVIGGVGLYSTNSSYVFSGVGRFNLEDVSERSLLPSVGAGLCFTLSTDKRINARIDYALGVNGNDGLYLGIMEAFEGAESSGAEEQR